MRVHDEEGALAQAGFRDGDVIVGVNGEEFKGAFELQAAMMRHMNDAHITLTVFRDDRAIEVKIEPKTLLGSNNMGGDIEPAAR